MSQGRIVSSRWTKPTLRQLLDDVRVGHALARRRRAPACAGCPFADLGFARVDHHRALRQGLPEAVYAPGKTPEQCADIVAELLAEPGGGPVLLTRADDAQAAGGAGRATRRARAPGTHRRVAAGAATGRAGCWSSPPAPPTSRWPTSASPPCSAFGFRPSCVADVRRGRRAPPARDGRRAGRRRRRRRRRGHGGRAGQPRRRHHRRRRWWRCPPASATAPPSRASPRCSPCCRRARRASPSSASTTASAPPARWPGILRCT